MKGEWAVSVPAVPTCPGHEAIGDVIAAAQTTKEG